MAETALQKGIEKLRRSLRIVPRNLIHTIYGDMLFPHHRPIWLGSLVAMTEPFGIPEFLSRTTTLRMAKVGWLDSTRIGRLSYYSVSDSFISSTIEYYNRVYNPPEAEWPGTWSLLLTGAAELSPKAYTALRRTMLWRGVGQIAPHVFISAAASLDSIRSLLDEHGIADKVQVLEATAKAPATPEVMRAIVASSWDIKAIEKGYESFLTRFRPIWALLEKGAVATPEQAYMIRALLMNEHRRLALHDPRLPRDFLPTVWAGNLAFALTRNLYQAVLEPSERYVREVVRTPDGPLPATPAEILSRFGGLELG